MVYVVVACRALLALVFLVSAVGKLRGRGAFGAFVAEIRAWRLVPARSVPVVAGGVVVAEAAVPVLSVVPVSAPFGPLVAGFLVAVFTLGIALTRRRGVSARCACFGRTATPLGRRHLVRNVLLLGAVGVALAPVTEPGTAPAVLVAVGSGALGALLITTMDEITALFAPLPDAPRS
ncbi:MauE/DoxX family redox-associated membrane protein [Streptomyces sp. NPDC088864]|uniref:MauE/DoxX family redox-associated membrane protein n=1 Tax=Streptomyces sp. NPDC088864 TaxID=3365910 RepID=UPI0037FE0C96